MIEELKKISIRGRVAYAAIALQRAFIKENIISIEVDFILDKIWEFTNSTALDDWEKMINEIMPLCVLDPKWTFDDLIYFDREVLLEMKEFYLKIPEYIADIIDWTISIGTDNIYGGTGEYSSSTLRPLLEVIKLCNEHNVTIPSIEPFEVFPFIENGGWGRCFTKNELIHG